MRLFGIIVCIHPARREQEKHGVVSGKLCRYAAALKAAKEEFRSGIYLPLPKRRAAFVYNDLQGSVLLSHPLSMRSAAPVFPPRNRVRRRISTDGW